MVDILLHVLAGIVMIVFILLPFATVAVCIAAVAMTISKNKEKDDKKRDEKAKVELRLIIAGTAMLILVGALSGAYWSFFTHLGKKFKKPRDMGSNLGSTSSSGSESGSDSDSE